MSSLETRIKRLEAQQPPPPERWRVVRPADLDSGAVTFDGTTYRDNAGRVLRRVIRVIRGDDNEQH